jgi:glycosyltransferase involved in cell wall biosynthesis
LTTVHFCGHQADIWPWLRLADIVVIPSLKESFGLVAVEAMAAARPVIVARTEGLVEVIEAGKSGVLFESGDGPSLTMAISQLIDDEAARSRLGRGGRQRYLEMFTSEAMAERWLAVYDKVSRPPGRIRPES